jgi:hypothetical protein
MRDANGKKRLDRAMAKVVDSLAKADIATLEGAHCLEVGAGFAPSDTLCLFLLGAASATATDYNAILQVDALQRAIAATDTRALEEAAAKLVARDVLADRLDRLRRACAGGLAGLETLGIRYLAPVDLSVARLDARYDLIYSISVFEHVPTDIIPAMLRNLADALSPSGVMLNEIHLEDHLDMVSDPFGFLRADGGYAPGRDADARGNRLRFGEWERLFGEIPGAETRIVGRTVRADHRPASTELLPQFAMLEPDDCFTARILVKTTAERAAPAPRRARKAAARPAR